MKRYNFGIHHVYGNQFAIDCTAEYFVDKGWGEYEKRIDEDYGYESMYYPSLVTLRVDLLTFCNKTFGTNYEVTDAMRAYADSFRNKLQDHYNIGIEVGWEFTDYGNFHHKYRFTGDGAWLGVCTSTYGDDWTKEQFIGLADAIVEYFATDPLMIAKAAMQEKYDMYNRIGIGHYEDPLYSKDGKGGEISADTNVKQVKLQ